LTSVLDSRSVKTLYPPREEHPAVEVGPGDTLCIERGQVHMFMAGDADASFLAIATPGVFGPDYFLEIAAVIVAADGPPDPQAMAAAMLRHGLTPVPQGVA
jgi:hypothetical protein